MSSCRQTLATSWTPLSSLVHLCIFLRTHLALLYNDRGVLENHHISAAYRLTQLPAFNIFVNVSRKKFQ